MWTHYLTVGLCRSLVCVWETKGVTNVSCPGFLHPPVPRYAQECWRSKLPDGFHSYPENHLWLAELIVVVMSSIRVVMSRTLMVSYSSILASVNLMTTSLSDSYHDLVWYHVTTVARSYEAELIDD